MGPAFNFSTNEISLTTPPQLSWRNQPLVTNQMPPPCIIQEILWELFELNFRIELFSLDCRVSAISVDIQTRLERLQSCVVDSDYFHVKIPSNNQGLVADNWEQ